MLIFPFIINSFHFLIWKYIFHFILLDLFQQKFIENFISSNLIVILINHFLLPYLIFLIHFPLNLFKKFVNNYLIFFIIIYFNLLTIYYLLSIDYIIHIFYQIVKIFINTLAIIQKHLYLVLIGNIFFRKAKSIFNKQLEIN